MGKIITPHAQRLVRHRRVRKKVSGSKDRPRLCVFRSLRHIYVQVIDDSRGHTLASASSLDLHGNGVPEKKDVPRKVGLLLAERALAQDIRLVVFDRGGYAYHGRVKTLADAAREGGLSF
mgnify:CR=1 FL=1